MVVKFVIENPCETMELVNIGQNNGYSVKHLANVISDLLGYSGAIDYNSNFQDGSPKRVMDNTLFDSFFPYFKFTDLDVGILETIEYYRTII